MFLSKRDTLYIAERVWYILSLIEIHFSISVYWNKTTYLGTSMFVVHVLPHSLTMISLTVGKYGDANAWYDQEFSVKKCSNIR